MRVASSGGEVTNRSTSASHARRIRVEPRHQRAERHRLHPAVEVARQPVGALIPAKVPAKTTVVFQNKTPTCQYRAVGHPIAVAITEGLVDMAAAEIGMDPVEIRQTMATAAPIETMRIAQQA